MPSKPGTVVGTDICSAPVPMRAASMTMLPDRGAASQSNQTL